MCYIYEYYTDSVHADSYEDACAYFAARHADFDEDEVWLDDGSDD